MGSTTIDIGIANIVPLVASSSASYLGTYEPLFLLIGGIVFAFAVISALLAVFTRGRFDGVDGMDIDDTIEI